jgi:quinol monooxygenase YgiN
VRQELRALLAPTRVERGCLNYDMHQSPDDEALFLFHENWESQADLDRHLAAPHLERWLALADDLLAEPMQLSFWRRVE